MKHVSVRELRNNGGGILDGVEKGRSMTVTRDGKAVALLSPLPRTPLHIETILERWANLPRIEPKRLRKDLDAILDPSL